MSGNLLARWPLVRQWRHRDPFGRGAAVKSATSAGLQPRTVTADKVVKSVCPYCGVGYAQNIYVKDKTIVHIEGDPDSPINRGRLCPKGAGTPELTTGRWSRQTTTGSGTCSTS